MCACTERPPIIVAGIDGAAQTGWAVLEARGDALRLLGHGSVAIRAGGDVERLVVEIASAGPALVAVEAPFVKPAARGGNPHSAIEIAVLLGRFTQALETHGIRTIPVLVTKRRCTSGITAKKQPANCRLRTGQEQAGRPASEQARIRPTGTVQPLPGNGEDKEPQRSISLPGNDEEPKRCNAAAPQNRSITGQREASR